MSSFLYSVCARSQSCWARSTSLAAASTAAFASCFSCGRAPFCNSARRASAARHLGAARLQVRCQARPLQLHRGLRLRQLRFAGRQSRRLALALRLQLVAVQPRDHLALLHRVALVHRALHQPPGGLERDVDFVQLDIAGDHQPVVRRLAHPAKHTRRQRRRPPGSTPDIAIRFPFIEALLHALADRAHRLRQVDPAPRCSCRARWSGCRAPAPAGSARRSLPRRSATPASYRRRACASSFSASSSPSFDTFTCSSAECSSSSASRTSSSICSLQVVGLHLLRAVLRRRFRAPRIAPSAVEHRNAHRDPYRTRGQRAVEARAARAVVAECRHATAAAPVSLR